jgi:hypothetical protein
VRTELEVSVELLHVLSLFIQFSKGGSFVQKVLKSSSFNHAQGVFSQVGSMCLLALFGGSLCCGWEFL